MAWFRSPREPRKREGERREDMIKYYVTFGQRWRRETHPYGGHPDGVGEKWGA